MAVVGPTASGKTEFAIQLCERWGGEIVSADSVQVYRHFDLGTGKPTAVELSRAPHHLIDIVEPDQALDAALWAELAQRRIEEIRSRGRVPIVCGGTFLWLRALAFGLAPTPPASPQLRAEHQETVERIGRAGLHAELQRVDPESAAKLSPNDFVRVSRALEVHALTGVPLSTWHASHGFRTPKFRLRLLAVQRSREELDLRIRLRVEAMLASGWIEEVRALISHGFGETRPMGSVGYKQIREVLQAGKPLDSDSLSDAIWRATRVFARRQRTWLRDQPVAYLEQARLA